MSQYSSRIQIKVVSPEVWNRFKDVDDAEFELAELAERGYTAFVLDDWSCVESELEGIVSALAKTLGTDGLIIADTTNINVDPYAYIVYSAGYGVHDKYRNYSEYCFETSIADILGCLNYKNHFSFSDDEIMVLNRLGIERVKEGKKSVFRQLLVNEGLEDELFLTETRFQGRTERIEYVNVGDPVRLEHDGSDKSYQNKVEVFSENGSLGYLEETAADIMAPILDAGEKQYTAVVRNVLPVSKRSQRCNSAIISIHIDVIPKQEEEKEKPTKAKSKSTAKDSGSRLKQKNEINTDELDNNNDGTIFGRILRREFSSYILKTKVPVRELFKDYTGDADPIDYVLYSAEVGKVAISIKTATNSRSKTFKAVALACEQFSFPFVLFDEKKDSTEGRIIPKVNEALYADVFKKYVIDNESSGVEEVPAKESGEGCSVKVKFADNRAYEYKCFEEIHVGEIVCVGGAKSGCRGMITAITGEKTFPGYYNVVKLIRIVK